MSDELPLHRLVGDWSGTDRLWFQPDEVANESHSAVTARPTLGGRALVYEYRWSMDDEEHHGTLLVTPTADGVQASWIDTFGTNGTIMSLSTAALALAGLDDVEEPSGTGGAPVSPMFDVLGSYDGDGVAWGWRIRLLLPDHDHLVLSQWNITPGGEQQLAVLGEYERVIDPHGDATI